MNYYIKKNYCLYCGQSLRRQNVLFHLTCEDFFKKSRFMQGKKLFSKIIHGNKKIPVQLCLECKLPLDNLSGPICSSCKTFFGEK